MTPEQASQLISRGRTDPAWWIETVLGRELWGEQIKILESIRDNTRTSVKSCHAIGKSFTAACAVLWFLATHKNSIVITTAPTERQVKGILWKEISMAYYEAKRRLGGTGLGGELFTQKLEFGPGWYAVGFTASNSDSFQGFHALHQLVVVDEACGVSPDIFSAIDALLTGEGVRQLNIGNPTNKATQFGDMFEPKSRVSQITVSAFQTPNFTQFGIVEKDILSGEWKDKITGPLPRPYLITPEWVEEMYNKWGKDSPFIQARILAEFPDEADDVLIPLAWIESSFERHASMKREPGRPRTGWAGPCIMSVDVARYGEDSSVFCFARDQGIYKLRRTRKTSTVETVSMVLRLLRDPPGGRPTEIRIDEAGVGGGVYDMLVAENLDGIDVIAMNAGRSPKDKVRFLNSRAEWFWNLRERMDPEGPAPLAIPRDDDIAAQLSSIRWGMNPNGKIKIESKDSMRARGLKSPDEADAIVMSIAPSYAMPDFRIDPDEFLGSNPWRI